MYLVHWPFPDFTRLAATRAPAAPTPGPMSTPSSCETWREMERLVDKGLVRHIGTSNTTVPKLVPLHNVTTSSGCERNGAANLRKCLIINGPFFDFSV